MLDLDLRSAWLRDLPVCFPGRSCVDEPPLGADVITVTSALTPSSAMIAAACFAVLGASLVLIGMGLRLQWRGSGLRPWLVVLSSALLVVGFGIACAVGGRFDAIAAIYSDVDGQPSATAPSSLIGAWPSVLFAGDVMVVVGGLALFAMLNTAVLRRRRDVQP